MLYDIMNHINNHFIYTFEYKDFKIVADGIEGSFTEKYLVGQYIWVYDTRLNDGVYKISGVTANKLTVEETLEPEDTGDSFMLYGLAVPKAFTTLATEIENYSSKDGIVSESIDDYSVSFGGTDGGDGSWTSVFAKRLRAYKKMYERVRTQTGWQNRLGCW